MHSLHYFCRKTCASLFKIFGEHFLVIDVLDFGFAGEVHGAALLHVLSTYFRKEARVWMRRSRIFLDCAQDGESRGS